MGRTRGPSLARLLRTRSIGIVGIIALVGFYVAWPIQASYAIRTSLEAESVEGLNAKIDFPSVRASLKPAVTEKVHRIVTDALRKAGPAGGALAETLKASVEPHIVDGVLTAFVTPEMLIRIHASGKSFKEALEGLVLERAAEAPGLAALMIRPDGGAEGSSRGGIEEIAGKLGIDTRKVLGGGAAGAEARTPAPELLPAKSGAKPTYGLGNIKHVSLKGPLGLSVGVARDAGARAPELTAELGFVDGTWKLTGLVPEP